jgi:hypothetical protein
MPLHQLAPRALLVTLVLAAAGAGASPAPPDDFPALIAAAGTATDHPGAATVAVFDRTDSDLEASGLAHVVNHSLVKILTEAGAVAQGTQRFDYDPATQVITVRKVLVHRAGGATEVVNPAEAIDFAQPAHAIYWGARMLTLQLPRLAVGDAVELETYRKGFMLAYLDPASGEDARYIPPMRGHWYDVQVFQAATPIKEKTVTVRSPRDKPLQFSVYNGEVFSETGFDSTHFTYRFWKRDCPALPTEWRGAAASDVAPKVVMASTEGWPQKSRWFWEANQHQFDTDPEIAALVAEITRGLRTDDEKVAAMNHWAAQNIRYCGLNMGEGEGYTLHPGDMILRERSGVCKDIAGMAITLCRAAGYEVYPAMTMAGSRVEPVPADQFNHCVGAWKKPDGAWEMLDPTWIPFARQNWSLSEGEQHYVIGTPWGEELAAIRTYAPAENQLTLTVRGEIDPTGALRGSVELRAAGEADTRLRRTIGQTPRDRVEADLRGWLARLAPGAELGAWRAGDPVDFGRAMWLDAAFVVPGFATIGRTTLSWHSAAATLAFGDYGGTVRIAAARGQTQAESRETPLFLWWAQNLILDEEIRPPRGFRPVAVKDEAWRSGETKGFAACDLRAEPTDKAMRVRGTVRFERRLVAPEDWPALRGTVRAFDATAETRLVARKKGA